MPKTPDQNESSLSRDITALLESGTFQHARRMLNSLAAPDAAHLLESSPPPSRSILWTLLDHEHRGEVLQFLGDELQAQILQGMDTQEVADVTAGLETDDLVDILQQLPNRVILEVLSAMSAQDRQRVTDALIYPENTAGGLMNTDTITVRPKHSLDVVLRYLRRHEVLPEMTDNLYVVSRKDKFLGLLPLRKILVSDPNITVREVMRTDVETIPDDMDEHEVAKRFERNNWVSAPVVDAQQRLLGRITIDDVVDIIREDADHSLMSMAGLDEEEDTFATISKSIPRRTIWLALNLITAFIAAGVINLFSETLDKVVALAVLMPIVASMGGVAGMQTLTVIIRGVAVGHIENHNSGWIINREVMIGLLNGLIWASVVAIAAALWFNDAKIGLIIAAAMLISLLTAALTGALLPLLLRALKVDPALAGGVALTTVTDVVGFLSFLGLATLFYA